MPSGRKRKYSVGYPPSPDKGERVRKAINLVLKEKVSIKRAAESFNLSYGFLQRRLSGEVDVDSRNGPAPVFNKAEETAMAHWLAEMARRGMGLTPKDFLEFVVVTREKRKTPFTKNLPGYDWYYGFVARNRTIIGMRAETPLEVSRAKISREDIDRWFVQFRNFLAAKDLLDKPAQLYIADETGFTMGSKAGKVIGPISRSEHVPHITSTKDRLTAMFCGNAEGNMIPPFLVYPGSRPLSCNPLIGAVQGTALEYSQSGWMNSDIFKKFIEHFIKHVGAARPVLPLIDSVSSHIDMEAFQLAIENQREIFRIIPNATHLLQPLDKGIFGPLKTCWNKTTREHYRQNPGIKINKTNFAEKLKDAYLRFYKPLTVINSFKASGIYPVDNTAISDNCLRPGFTYHEEDEDTVQQKNENAVQQTTGNDPAIGALKAFESVLSTPVKATYRGRIQEDYDLVGMSPVFDVYKKLYCKAYPESLTKDGDSECPNEVNTMTHHEQSGDGHETITEERSDTQQHITDTAGGDGLNVSRLGVLAEAAFTLEKTELSQSGDTSSISKHLEEALTFPNASCKPKKQRLLDHLPNNLTSKQSIRELALKDLTKIREFAQKEKNANRDMKTEKIKAPKEPLKPMPPKSTQQ